MDAGRSEQLLALATTLQIELSDVSLYDRALTHASTFPTAHRPSCGDYESLEFLGDATLGLAISHYLFQHIPDRTPGEYSRLRAGLVNRRCLARIARELNIAPAIRLGKGEELSGGRQRDSLLADCLEALVGAIYLDRGWPAAQTFVARIFQEELERELASNRLWDFKSRLQNYCQAQHIPLPQFIVVKSEGPDHRKKFEVEVLLRGEPAGRGTGFSKKEAEQCAAKLALESEGQNVG